MINKNLLSVDKYCLATFGTTHHALHAEKVLAENNLPFIIIPTPKEISAGCGLAIRFFCDHYDNIVNKLAENNIPVNQFYEAENSRFKRKSPI